MWFFFKEPRDKKLDSIRCGRGFVSKRVRRGGLPRRIAGIFSSRKGAEPQRNLTALCLPTAVRSLSSCYLPVCRRPLRLCVFARNYFFLLAKPAAAGRQDTKDLMRVGKEEKKSQPLTISIQKK